jgi:hypothetical protein
VSILKNFKNKNILYGSFFLGKTKFVHIPDGAFDGIVLTNMMYGFLYFCQFLQTAVIPAGINNFSYAAFYGCMSLQWVEFKDVTPGVVDSQFLGGIQTGFVIYVPDGAVDAYKAAPGWDAYADRIVAVSERNV